MPGIRGRVRGQINWYLPELLPNHGRRDTPARSDPAQKTRSTLQFLSVATPMAGPPPPTLPQQHSRRLQQLAQHTTPISVHQLFLTAPDTTDERGPETWFVHPAAFVFLI